MKSYIKTMTLTALAFVLSVSVYAQQRYNPDPPRGDRQAQMQKMRANQGAQHQRLLSLLDLSDEQLEQIQEIHLNGQKEMLPLRSNMQEKKAQLQTLTISDNYDEAAVKSLITEISELRGTMMTKRITHRQQIRELLTENQRVKFDAFHMNMQKRGPRKGVNK